MPIPHFYGPDDGAGQKPIGFFEGLFRSDDWFPLLLMLLMAIFQLLALIPVSRRPNLASVFLFFAGSFAYFLAGIAALLLRLASATQVYDGPPLPHLLIHAECVGAVGAALSLCFLLIGFTFYVFSWRHSFLPTLDAAPNANVA